MRDLLGWILGWFGRGRVTQLEILFGEGIIYFPNDEGSIKVSNSTGQLEMASSEGSIKVSNDNSSIYVSNDIGYLHGTS